MRGRRATGRNRAIVVARAVTRGVTALPGGYFAAAGCATLIARLLPVAPAEATAWGMIISFLIMAIFGLWSFYESRLLRVAGIIWGTGALTTAAIVALGVRA